MPTKLDLSLSRGSFGFFLTKPLFCLVLFVCLFLLLLFLKHPIYFYRGVSPPFGISQGLK